MLSAPEILLPNNHLNRSLLWLTEIYQHELERPKKMLTNEILSRHHNEKSPPLIRKTYKKIHEKLPLLYWTYFHRIIQIKFSS